MFMVKAYARPSDPARGFGDGIPARPSMVRRRTVGVFRDQLPAGMDPALKLLFCQAEPPVVFSKLPVEETNRSRL